MGDGGDAPDQGRRRYRPTSAQWSLAGLILAFVVGLVLFRVLKGVGLGQTAAFYIGIPTVLALILTLTAPSGRMMGMTLKAITILLLLAIPVAGETFVCVIIAAPLFYAVGIAVVLIVRLYRKSDGTARIAVLPAVALVLSMEGVVPALTLPGDNTVSASRVVTATPAEVAAALARPLRFSDTAPSGLLALGFPKPMMDHGAPLSVGAQRTVMFEGGHHRPAVMAASHWGEMPSALDLEVAATTADSVTFRPVSDATPLATWLTWRAAEVSWHAVDATHTDITWSLSYTRRLAPAWYFAPIEALVTQRAAAYLVDAIDLGR